MKELSPLSTNRNNNKNKKGLIFNRGANNKIDKINRTTESQAEAKTLIKIEKEVETNDWLLIIYLFYMNIKYLI